MWISFYSPNFHLLVLAFIDDLPEWIFYYDGWQMVTYLFISEQTWSLNAIVYNPLPSFLCSNIYFYVHMVSDLAYENHFKLTPVSLLHVFINLWLLFGRKKYSRISIFFFPVLVLELVIYARSLLPFSGKWNLEINIWVLEMLIDSWVLIVFRPFQGT